MNKRLKLLTLVFCAAFVALAAASIVTHADDLLAMLHQAPPDMIGAPLAGMMLFQRKTFFTPSQFALSSAGVLGTTQKYALDRTWPIEEIILHVNATCGSTGPTPRTGSTGVIGLDALLGIVKRINLTVNDGIQPRSVVDYSGPGLLEYAGKVGMNLDSATLEAIRLWQLQAAYANNLKFRYSIRIPLVHPLIAEPLRTQCLLPVHTYPQDPILTLDFESGSNMYSAGSLSDVQVEVDLVRRQMSGDVTKTIIEKKGGFIPFDLIETPFSIATGVSGEQRFAIPTPGQYLNLLFRQYLGGSTVARDVLDQTTTFASESRWRLETGGVVLRDWRWKQLQVINELSQVQNGLQNAFGAGLFVAASSGGAVTTAFPTITPSPQIGGAIASNTAFRPAASCLMDFLTDGMDSAAELGSLLDCELPAKTGLKMEVIGPVASVSSNASQLSIGGHRLYGDLSRWQAI